MGKFIGKINSGGGWASFRTEIIPHRFEVICFFFILEGVKVGREMKDDFKSGSDQLRIKVLDIRILQCLYYQLIRTTQFRYQILCCPLLDSNICMVFERWPEQKYRSFKTKSDRISVIR